MTPDPVLAAALADFAGAVGPFLLKALKFLFIAFEVLLIFNLLIFVHELGHFLAAKWRGLHIEEFALWFGKPLWRKKIGGVWYAINSIPAGGYVKLPQMAPMESMEGQSEVPRDQLQPISALDKIIVAFAGPLFSFLLAVFFAVLVWGVGRPVAEAETTTQIGYVKPGSPAAEAGLQSGDVLLEVDNQHVSRWGGIGSDSVQWRIIRSEGETVPIKYKRVVNGEEVVLTTQAKPVIPDTHALKRKGLRQLLMEPAESLVVGEVKPESTVAKAGFQVGDVVKEVNGTPVHGYREFMDALGKKSGSATFVVSRNDERVELQPVELKGPVIRGVTKESPAEAAGLQLGDRVVSIDGQAVYSSTDLVRLVNGSQGKPLEFTVDRSGTETKLTVQPQFVESENTHLIGVSPADDIGLGFHPVRTLMYPTPWEQVRKSARSIFDTIDAIASNSSVRLQHMGGPVTMMRAYYTFFELGFVDGWRLAFWFSVVLNVNLALLNLLPLPVLDGGHIVLAIVEGIRRRPVNLRVLEWVQTACAALIIGFMLYIFFFDVGDLFSGESKLRFKSPPAAKP